MVKEELKLFIEELIKDCEEQAKSNPSQIIAESLVYFQILQKLFEKIEFPFSDLHNSFKKQM